MDIFGASFPSFIGPRIEGAETSNSVDTANAAAAHLESNQGSSIAAEADGDKVTLTHKGLASSGRAV